MQAMEGSVMAQRTEGGLWRRGVLVGMGLGVIVAVVAVFAVSTLWAIEELRDDVEALEAAMVPGAYSRREIAPPADPVMAAVAADVLSRAGGLQGKGCEAQVGASAPGADTGARPGRSVSAAEWLESTAPGS